MEAIAARHWPEGPPAGYRRHRMLVGLLCGLAAGAFWGLTFVAPRAVAPYGEIDLAILRYVAFGLTSLALMAVSARFRPGRLDGQRIRTALFLGLTGYVLYYIAVAYSVSLAGPAIAPLVIGALPVLLALYGNWRERAAGWGAIYGNWQDRNVPWRRIAVPLGLIVAGLAVINVGTFRMAGSAAERGNVLLGALLAAGGLAVWFWYAVVNARAMRAADAPPALAWTSLQGVGAMLGIIPVAILAPLFGWGRMPEAGIQLPAAWPLLGWAILTGVIGSWVAQFFWTVASQRLPLALSAQLIVSETIFALAYGFLFEGRWPHAHEWAGAALLVGGVVAGVRSFSARRAA
jgi:drug/metabolite transporter (DMT)-like permease